MRKKGFTLIELLAVILIMAIIALIAIPTVSKIIYQSKKGAFETTANNVVNAIEDACEFETLKGQSITTTYTFNNGEVSPNLIIKGKLPTSGTATVDSSCHVTLSVTNGKFTAKKLSTDDNVSVVDGDEVEETPTTYTVYTNGTAVYFNPETGKTCNSGEAVSTTGTKTGCMKWYTFNDDGASSNTINLLLNHNTTAMIAWSSSSFSDNGPIDLMTQLASDTISWTGVPTRTDSYIVNSSEVTYTINYDTYKARLITADDIAKITGNSVFKESTPTYSDWFFLDSNNQTQVATTAGASNYAWLFDYSYGCTDYGCNVDDPYNYGYWTSTAVHIDNYNAWYVGRNGFLDFNCVHILDLSGVRPVITIDKSIFE